MLRISSSKEMLLLVASKPSRIMMKNYSVPPLPAKELTLNTMVTLCSRVFNMTQKISSTRPSELIKMAVLKASASSRCVASTTLSSRTSTL